MKKIYYIMGKSASGKDTVYKKLLLKMPEMKTVTMYTTRPIREGENNGHEYNFVSEDKLSESRKSGKLIEVRTYNTVHGPWSYFTLDDGQFSGDDDILMIGTLESYENMLKYFGEERMVPIFIYVNDGIRLERALKREREQKEPKYSELCRRYLADEEDFKEENMKRCKIKKLYINDKIDSCVEEIVKDIKNSH